jgi:hypothetical protein
MTRFHTLSFSLILIVAVSSRAETISASAARDHVGENATVCGHVASTRFAARYERSFDQISEGSRFAELGLCGF